MVTHLILSLLIIEELNKRLISVLTCHTPTIALAIRISKITKGSTKAVRDSSSSNIARTWKKILTLHYNSNTHDFNNIVLMLKILTMGLYTNIPVSAAITASFWHWTLFRWSDTEPSKKCPFVLTGIFKYS
jgi:hypothetical protein